MVLKRLLWEITGMVLQLRVLTIFPEDQALTTISNFSSGEPALSSTLHGHCIHMPYLPSYRHMKIHFLRQGLTLQLWLSWNLRCRPGWPRTHKVPLAPLSYMLGLKACTTTPSFFFFFNYKENFHGNFSAAIMASAFS